MNFITLEKDQFEEFARKSPYKSFMQTKEIAEYRESNGWTPYYLGVEEGGKIKAASMLVAKPTFLGKSTYFAPGGPLVDLEDTVLTNYFFKNLRHYIKTHNGYTLVIDPYYELVERGRDGEPKENGFNHKNALKNLKLNGFKEITGSMPKYLFTLTLKNKTKDQLFADLKRNTRNHIRKAEKTGVKIRELKREELSIFKEITESTSKRRNFTDKPLSYYEKMYDLFHKKEEIKFILAEAPDGTPLSAAMFILYGDEVVYLFSGSDEKYMKEYNAQYLIQWHMIKYACEHKFKVYNFYGISGIPNKSDKDYGIYDFKKGFTTDETGKVVELVGTFELPVNQTFFTLHQFLSKIKHRK